MRAALILLMVMSLACSGSDVSPGDDASMPADEGFQPPVATNPTPPFAYPADLYRSGIEGTVILRLFIDETGAIVHDSTQLAESSGYPPLDSAALAGVVDLEYVPALRDGTPIATVFLQPVHFRQPESGS
jgi:TonB family protein